MAPTLPAPPALTAGERAAFAAALVDAERRLPEVLAQRDRLGEAPGVDADEVDDASDALAFAQDRVTRLRALLAHAPAIDAPLPDEARLNSRVRVRHAGHADGTEAWYRVRFSAWEMARRPDVIDVSWGSPIAQALVGRRPGDRSVITAPAGETAITLLDVRHDAP